MFTRSEIIEIFIIAGIILILIFLLFFIKGLIPNDYPKVSNPLDLKDLKTGDILSVSYKNSFGVFVSAWSNSVWSHPGMIYKCNDTEIFVIEAARYRKKSDNKWKGVFMIPLNTWLKFNEDHIISITKYSGKLISNNKVESAFLKIKGCKLQTFTPSWIRLLRKEEYDPIKLEIKDYVCYEILIRLLQELNVVRKKYLPSAYWPSDICWGRLDLEEGVEYSEPVLLNL
jgi:hypothetical protein